MGKTAYTGPLYGAKQTLASIRVSDISSGAGNGVSTSLSVFLCPLGEDWYGTEFSYHRQSTGSTGIEFSVQDDGTKFSSITITSSAADQLGYVSITADAGEYEGRRIAAGSTVSFNIVQSSVAPASSGVSLALYGYRRFISSSLARGE